ncbi:MAG: Secretion system C-terminal sorting domain [Bacteroidota bacterium]|jgi:hypothetical protein
MKNLNAYPNPAREYVTIEYRLPEYAKNATIVIRDVANKEIQRMRLSATQGQFLWDTRAVGQGFYLFSIQDAAQVNLHTGKISIIK